MSAADVFAKDKRHKECHSCVIVVLAHGEYDHLLGCDGEKVNVHNFVECFNENAAPGLAGKPKIFFLQSCRGGT